MADADIAQIRRVCTCCKQEKPATLEFYPPHKIGKYGLHSWCIPCKKRIDAERRIRPDQQARQQAWRDANKGKTKDYNLAYRQAGYSSTEDVAQWRVRNLDHARAKARAQQRKRMEDPAFVLKQRMSARLNVMLRDKGGRRSEDLLGYSKEELRRHIERQFTKGMSWELLRKGEIEIDHIIPVRAFNITSFEDPDFKVCWGLSNLRPMWRHDNRSKNGKRLHLL